MAMTMSQKKFVSRYLDGIALRLSDLPPHQREQIIDDLSQRISNEFGVPEELSNIEVQRYLAKFGGVVKHAAAILECYAEEGPEAFSEVIELEDDNQGADMDDGRIWLGVCSGIAHKFNLAEWGVRSLFILLGLSGPFSLIVYLLVYAMMYSRSAAMPQISRLKLLIRTAGALAVLVTLCIGTQVLLELTYFLFLRYTEHTVISLGNWGWFEADGATIFFSLLIIITPMAILSGLPLANAWDETFRVIVKAIIAVYILIICFGISSSIVGMIIQFVEHLTRKDLVI